MLRSIEMKLFRGIKEGVLKDFTPLVVLVGPNGSGKSAVLDAILIAANPNPAEGIGQAVLRREGIVEGSPWLLWKQGAEGAAELIAEGDVAEKRFCKLTLVGTSPHFQIQCDVRMASPSQSFSPDRVTVGVGGGNTSYSTGGSARAWTGVPKVHMVGQFLKNYQAPLHELFSNVIRQGLRSQINQIVQGLVPGFEWMETLTENGVPVLYIDFADRAVPVALSGDGIASLIRLAFEMVTSPGGIILMEEPEIHMHPGAIYKLARVIIATIQRGVQVVLTTHSLDLIDGLLSEASKVEGVIDKLSVYQLVLRDGLLKSSRLSGSEVRFARSTIEDDLR
jgi:predicted ATPase